MSILATNTAANTALRYLNKNSAAESAYLAKISSGQRIQRASDDAAGLGIATRLKSDVTVLSQNAINAQHGQSVLQTADGALSNIGDILQRMKSLATQTISGAVDDSARAYVDAEYQQLLEEIDSIVNSTDFNNTVLLDGSYSSDFLVGTDGSAAGATSNRITVTLTGADTTTLTVNGTDVTSVANAETAIAAIDAAIDTISSSRADVGAMISRFSFQADVISTSLENLSAAQSVLMDADIADMQTKYSSADALTQAGISALTAANQMPSKLLRLLQ